MTGPLEPLRICWLSHLAWERTLFQRPQQLAVQFDAAGCEVLYISLIGLRRWLRMPGTERSAAIGSRGHAVNAPFLPAAARVPAIGRLSLARAAAQGRAFLASAPAGRRILWLQHPAWVRAVDSMPHDALVYDCMDPFEAFRKTEAEVAAREPELLRRADVVFTGGRSLHAQREGMSRNMHCLPSGVDIPHFAKAADEGEADAGIAALPGPVIGYIGAIDERMDWDLLRALCRTHRDWSVALVGPLVLMDRLPLSEPNLHWLGPRRYDDLPDALRGMRACMIPWKVNHLTRFMSPTKTPEYLAAGRPVASVPIPDVVGDYGDEVFVGDGPESFVGACERAMDRGPGPSLKPPAARTWEETAGAMLDQVRLALARRGS